MIEFDSISKVYSNRTVLFPFSYILEEGRSLAILGPNGAGKTTLIRMTLGVIPPTRGSVKIWNQTIKNSSFSLKRQIGVVLEEQNFMLDVTAIEYLRFFSELYEVDNPDERIVSLLEYMELGDAAHKKIREYSTGMKRKLNIIQAVLHNPKILIIDELFSGLDPIGISLTMNLLKKIKSKGTTLILSSHILSDLDDLVDDVLIIHQGVCKAVGKKEDVWESFNIDKVGKVQVLKENVPLFLKILSELSITSYRLKSETIIEFTIPSSISGFRKDLAKKVLEYKVGILSLSYEEPKIQQLYSKVMNYKEVEINEV
jgi:ABC-2 type transport system ATP-binding protein